MVGLPKSMRYNIIIICVDRLTKIRYFMLIINKIIAEGTANLFIINVYKLHGFPNIVMFNHGP